MVLPDFLGILNVDEERLISRVDVVFRAHKVTRGGLGMKGTSTVIPKPQQLNAESVLPRSECDVVVIKRRGTQEHLVIRRQVCKTALCGLVFGISHRRQSESAPGQVEYLFPRDDGYIDCYGNTCVVNGGDGWEIYAVSSCPAYSNVRVNFEWIPPVPVEFDADAEDANDTPDLGPAPEMLDQDASGLDIFGAINFSDNLSAMKRLKKKIRELQRANDTSGTVGIVDTSVGQLSQHDALARDVEFYWTMAFPKLFPFAMGDRSSPSFGQVVPMSLTQWADFLWYHGSGRFAAHPVSCLHTCRDIRTFLSSQLFRESIIICSIFTFHRTNRAPSQGGYLAAFSFPLRNKHQVAKSKGGF